MSLQELNLCINYTSELDEGAGVPQTAFAFIRKHAHTLGFVWKQLLKLPSGGARGPLGEQNSPRSAGGWPRWGSFRPSFHSASWNHLINLAHLPAVPSPLKGDGPWLHPAAQLPPLLRGFL